MRFTRLISAITLVAAVTVLGSCGGSSAPTSAGTDPSANLGPREFALMPSQINWDRGLVGDPIPTDTKTVLIAGIIPLASYPSFGAPVYSGGADNWLDMDLSPNFSRSPLGWIASFKLKQAAQDLPEGSYTATILVTVPAALNNPQMITISFGCHQLEVDGPYKEGNLTSDTPRWDRDTYEYNNDAAGGYAYQDWCVFVPPLTRVWVWQQGGYDGCPGHDVLGYTLYDSYLYTFTQPDHEYVESDDDGACGYDSLLDFYNSSTSPKEYLIRSTSYDTYDEEGVGTYRIQVNTYDPYYGDGEDLHAPGRATKPVKPPRRAH